MTDKALEALDRLVAMSRAMASFAEKRPHLNDEDKATLAERARKAKEKGLMVRALSEWEASIFQCPRCQGIFPWSWGIVVKDLDGGAITVCESCADAGTPEPGLTKVERGL